MKRPFPVKPQILLTGAGTLALLAGLVIFVLVPVLTGSANTKAWTQTPTYVTANRPFSNTSKAPPTVLGGSSGSGPSAPSSSRSRSAKAIPHEGKAKQEETVATTFAHAYTSIKPCLDGLSANASITSCVSKLPPSFHAHVKQTSPGEFYVEQELQGSKYREEYIAGAQGSQKVWSQSTCAQEESPGVASCLAFNVISGAASPDGATTTPHGFGPAQFHTGYSLPTETPSSSGKVIAIVDAYDDPAIENDLNVFDTREGLPACTVANGCFEKLNETGNPGPYPEANNGWTLEEALDVEVAHDICQNCKIRLFEASSNSDAALGNTVNAAVAYGATVISNSYGGGEFPEETSYNSYYNHPGVVITVSSGDGGWGPEFPSVSPDVVAVGGTKLNLTSENAYSSEEAWAGAGSGCSVYMNAQSWQTSLSKWNETACGTSRATADISADANPLSGASVYDSIAYDGTSGWWQVGGTSLASPLIASVFALDGGANGVPYPAKTLYENASDFHDVTTGSNGACLTIICKAATGWDGPTGLGTPRGLTGF